MTRMPAASILVTVKRPILIALALLAAAAVAVPVAHGRPQAQASKTYSSFPRFFQQHAADIGGVSIILNAVYASKHRNGKFTPRTVYLGFEAPVSCELGGSTAADVRSGPFKLRHSKVKFSGVFTNQAPATDNPNPGSTGVYYATGRLIKKKNERKWRVDGTVTVLSYSFPPTFLNCASPEVSYSAGQCWSTAAIGGHPPFCAEPYQAPKPREASARAGSSRRR